MERKTIGYERISHLVERQYEQEMAMRRELEGGNYTAEHPYDAEIQEGWVLQLFPRSSLGFTYRLQFNNTVGIIDSDYFESDNEGHIFIKMMNDSTEGKTVQIRKGDGFAQGIFLPFGICEDDDVQKQRNGGFGSTNE